MKYLTSVFENSYSYEDMSSINKSLPHFHRVKFILNDDFFLTCIAGHGCGSSLKEDINSDGKNIDDFYDWEISVFNKDFAYSKKHLKFFHDIINDDVLAGITTNKINEFLNVYGIKRVY